MRGPDYTLTPEQVERNEAEYTLALALELDMWVAACAGTEVPFVTRTGRWLHYLFNPAKGSHAYYDCATDIALTDAEARAAFGID